LRVWVQAAFMFRLAKQRMSVHLTRPRQVDLVVDPTAPADPELAELAAAWSSLPRAIRAGILAMLQASRPVTGADD
jgi:hypothetical protein